MSRQVGNVKLRAYENKPDADYNKACITCTQPYDDDGIIAFTDHFKVILHPNQSAVGSALIATRRHVGRICDFNASESTELVPLFSALEPALEAAFGAALVNMEYQRNWAFREKSPDPPFRDGKPNPHVHFHVVPRYAEPVSFKGITWEDPAFGEPFVWRSTTVDRGTRAAIIREVQSRLDLTYEERGREIP